MKPWKIGAAVAFACGAAPLSAIAMEKPPGTVLPVGQPALQAAAFSGPAGSTWTFKETARINGTSIPDIRGLTLGRPATVRVSAPPLERELGSLRYLVGDASAPVRRRIVLRHRASLGGSRHSLANQDGFRVVLFTRSRNFVEVKLPPGVRGVAVLLNGEMTKHFRIEGTCKALKFSGSFQTTDGRTSSDTDAISTGELKRARSCR